jgi:predicted Zn-dependent protease
MPLEPREAEAVLHDVLARVKKVDPKVEARAALFSARSANTRFARNEVTTSGETDETDVTLYIASGKRHAEASSNQIEPAALDALVQRTLSLARIAPEDPEAMPVLGAQKLPASAAFDDAAAKLTAQARADMANASIEHAKSKGLVIAGFISNVGGTQALATSAGLSVAQKLSSLTMSATARTADGSGSGWAGTTSRLAKDVDAAKLARVACEKAALSKGARKLEPGRYTVLLEPAATWELVDYLFQALDARATDEGRSFFSKPGGGSRLGETVLSPRVTLDSNPGSPLTPNATFDGDGLPLPGITWVDQGVVKALRTSRFWAQKKGTKPNAGYGGYALKPGTDDVDAMLAGIKRGVLITRFWYSNWVDPQTMLVTGLTRDGTFLVEDGKIVSAVNNFRVNESVAKVFEHADALGKEAALVGRPDVRCPAVRTHEFNLAAVSDAV